jgi:hypothetical protein
MPLRGQKLTDCSYKQPRVQARSDALTLLTALARSGGSSVLTCLRPPAARVLLPSSSLPRGLLALSPTRPRRHHLLPPLLATFNLPASASPTSFVAMTRPEAPACRSCRAPRSSVALFHRRQPGALSPMPVFSSCEHAPSHRSSSLARAAKITQVRH